MSTLEATCSGGGPVIALPVELAATWRGTSPPVGAVVPEGWTWGKAGVVCDYDRACDSEALRDFDFTPSGGVGWLDVGDGAALILDAELMTAWLTDAEGGYVIRNYPDETLDEAAARGFVAEADAAGWRELSLEWTLQGGLVLFDSAYPGAAEAADIEASDGVAVAAIAAGTYAVAIATTPAEIDVIRLRRIR